MTRIGFVCTNYNNSRYTIEAVESLQRADKHGQLHVVVVDNNSSREAIPPLIDLGRNHPRVEVLLNDQNVGYFGGLNVGLRRLQENQPGVRHVVVGNNDLLFPETFVDDFERNAATFDTRAVIAPDLVTTTGLHQNPHVSTSISWARKLIWDLYYSSYGAALIVKGLARLTSGFTSRKETRPGNDFHLTPGPIAMGLGACYVLGPIFFDHYASLFAPTFLMNEEFFLAEQLKAIGQMIYYDPRFVVIHHDHATMDLVPSRRYWSISRDAHRIYKRYLGLPQSEREEIIQAQTRPRP